MPLSDSQVSHSYLNSSAHLSPRAIRRKILKDEMTKSIRREIVRERQQSARTTNMNRRNISNVFSYLGEKDLPIKPYMGSKDENITLWKETPRNGYHSKGW